jgi:hypothetical protein
MRRTQAQQLRLGGIDDDPVLAELRCDGCGEIGQVSIVAMGADDRGAVERAFCGPACASPYGWPPWASERSKAA